MAERITEKEFEEKVIQNETNVLLDFYSETCIPCKRMSAVIANLEEEHLEHLIVYKVNINYETALTEKYDVLSVPTFLLLSEGKEIGRLTGVQSVENLEQLIKKGEEHDH